MTPHGNSVSITFHLIKLLYGLPRKTFSFGHINTKMTQNITGVVSVIKLFVSVKKPDYYYFYV